MMLSLEDDRLQHLLFPRLGVRGAWLRLSRSLAQMPALGRLPQAAHGMLTAAVSAAALLQGNLKADTRLRLQLQGDHRLRLLYAECGGEGGVRGLMRLQEGLLQPPPLDQLDAAAVLAVTLEPQGGQRYQALVPLEGGRLDTALGRYFERSEQLPTRLLVAGDGDRGAGLLLQRMPGSGGVQQVIDGDGWNRLGLLLDTLGDAELLDTDGATLLHRLFHEEVLEVSAGKSIRFACSCSRERVERMFQALGREESLLALRADGVAEVDCEFCAQQYHFDRVDLEGLFHGPLAPSSAQQH